jgi:sigma-B regulation protein RsbU (phosphoserine phosphatase)
MPHTPGAILIADDDAASRAACEDLLRRDHHSVTAVPDGRRALEALREHAFDLVLLDIGMPEVDGFEVLAHIRSEGLYPDMPVIMTSALDDVDSVLRCIDLGAHGYLLKPFDTGVLLRRVSEAMRLRRLRASARARRG